MLRRLFITFTLILALTALLASCNRSSDEVPAEQADAGQPAAGGPPEPSQPATAPDDAASVPMRLTDEGRSRSAEAVAVPADPRDSAFESARLSALPVYAADTVLGSLAYSGVTSARDRAVRSVCAELFAALLEGELPTDLVSDSMGPGGRALLEDLIWAANTLSQMRMGLVTELTSTEVSVPFRLMGDERQAVGEVIVEKLGEQWYTADIQFELEDRDTDSRFDPAAVRVGNTL